MDERKNLRGLFLLLVALSLVTRFMGLRWGDGFFFHPDENNMARAIVGIDFPRLDPKFYAYGQFPLFLTFFTNYFFGNNKVDFSQAVYGLRFWSAIFSTATVMVGYFLAKFLFRKKKLALIYGFLLIFTPGLIQAGHFGTTESILTFVFLSLSYFSYRLIKERKISYFSLFQISLLAGIGLATKITTIIFIIPLYFCFLCFFWRKEKRLKFISKILFLSSLTIGFFFLFSPFYFLNWREAFSTLKYESAVAAGKIMVFYTRQFIDSKAIIFQFTKVFPWALGLPMFILFLISLLLFGLQIINYWLTSSDSWKKYSILVFPPLVWFLFNGFLFVKWVRFMVPLLPFLILSISWLFKKTEMWAGKNVYRHHLNWISFLVCLVPGVLFLKLYLNPDIRVQTSQWLNKNLPDNSIILSEAGNVIDLPTVNEKNLKVINFDFYQLEDDPVHQEKLKTLTEKADYVLLPSRRVFASHSAKDFPKTVGFYKKLFSGDSGFVYFREFKVFTPWEEILLGSDINSEETWTVFDHPTIRLYKRI